VVQPAGGLKRLAAAVLVDDALEVHEEKGKKVEKRRKRTQDEMKQFQELAMAAIGFDAARGDRVAIENLSFQSLPLEVPENPTATERWAPMVQKWMGLIRYLALAALFGLVYVLFLRPMKRQMLAILKPAVALAGAGSPRRLSESAPVSPAAELDAESPLLNESTEVGSEAKRAVMLKRHLVDKVKREPAQASRLVENWLREGEGRK